MTRQEEKVEIAGSAEGEAAAPVEEEKKEEEEKRKMWNPLETKPSPLSIQKLQIS